MFDYYLFDFVDCFCWVEIFWVDLGVVYDGVVVIEFEWVIEIV